jgi:tRNA dimethylallyltransferase
VSDADLERALRIADEDADAVVAIVGPTASGKTALAVALAEKIDGEIVSADSVQIYRGFDVGSGKPSPQERERAVHHLVDAIEPLDPIDAASWAERATRVMAEVRARGRRPIVCGGTFLWVKALLFGLAEAPAASAPIRERHQAWAQSEGRAALHARLREVDPASAERLHPNDLVRVSRALEVLELTGKPLSAWQSEHAFATVRHRARILAIAQEPAALTARIEARVRTWLAGGWIEEVESLVARGYGRARAMSSVGYAEVHAHVRGELAHEELGRAIVRATRTFARRQRTWLNHADVTLVPPAVTRAIDRGSGRH